MILLAVPTSNKQIKDSHSLNAETPACCEDNKFSSVTNSFVSMKNSQSSYLYLLGIINSSLMQAFYRLKFTADTNIFPKIRVEQVRDLPIRLVSEQKREIIAERAKEILDCHKELKEKEGIRFSDIINKYAAASGPELEQIIKNVPYSNIIYNGNDKKLRCLNVLINDDILTLYHSKINGNNRSELLKFVVKDRYRREYLKLFFSNLSDEHYVVINQYSGNVMDKTLKIIIPDYDKTETIKSIVNMWRKHSRTIEELKEKIVNIDNEIDKMVYDLYELNEAEIHEVKRFNVSMQ